MIIRETTSIERFEGHVSFALAAASYSAGFWWLLGYAIYRQF